MKTLIWINRNLERTAIGLLLAVMSLSTILQVVMRYVFDNSLIWSEELTRYCFVWLVFLGTSYAVQQGAHIRLELINRFVKGKLGRWLDAFGDMVLGAFALYLIPVGVTLIMRLIEWGEISPALHIPMWLVYSAVPVGLGLTAVRCVQSAIRRIKADGLSTPSSIPTEG